MLIPPFPADLCLSFANTLTWRGSEQPSESLTGLDDVLAWCAKRARLDADDVAALRASVESSPRRQARELAAAIELRETIFRIFIAIAAGRPVAAADLAALNRFLDETPARRCLEQADGVYAWAADRAARSVVSLLAPVVWSAGDLLTRSGSYRIRRCANERCGWLFIDESKAGTRRWCDMSSCGNRAKAQRHYQRHKRP
jgi:predicted RNA-binding Zn ribbon-like protein